jgi:hypothetical protein
MKALIFVLFAMTVGPSAHALDFFFGIDSFTTPKPAQDKQQITLRFLGSPGYAEIVVRPPCETRPKGEPAFCYTPENNVLLVRFEKEWESADGRVIYKAIPLPAATKVPHYTYIGRRKAHKGLVIRVTGDARKVSMTARGKDGSLLFMPNKIELQIEQGEKTATFELVDSLLSSLE